jgi:hypothetical protein
VLLLLNQVMLPQQHRLFGIFSIAGLASPDYATATQVISSGLLE